MKKRNGRSTVSFTGDMGMLPSAMITAVPYGYCAVGTVPGQCTAAQGTA